MICPTRTIRLRIADDLASRYADTYPRQEIAAVLDAAWAELERDTRHPEFVPLLAEHRAREVLRDRVERGGRIFRPVPQLLFVSVHNECRSQLAAALTEHLGGGRVHARAAGALRSGGLEDTVVSVLRERGVDVTAAFPAGRAHDVVNAADVVVRMGADADDLPGRRYVDWDVEDRRDGSVTECRRVRDELEARVRELLVEFDVPVIERVTGVPQLV